MTRKSTTAPRGLEQILNPFHPATFDPSRQETNATDTPASVNAQRTAGDRPARIQALRDALAQCLSGLGRLDLDAPAAEDTASTDPVVRSWYSQSSGQYARVIEIAGRGAVTTWPTADLPDVGVTQSLPSYCDIAEVCATEDFVYVASTGLPSHPMGPWQNQEGVLGVWPTRRRRIFRIPKRPWLSESGIVSPPGDAGVWVNGIPMSGLLDGWCYNPARKMETVDTDSADEPYRRLWLRHAGVLADTLVDPANGRPLESGDYRYHVNPLGLRSQLRDNLVYLPRADCYREDPSNARHSPILGWTFEGLPVYGPYGYADPLDAHSGVRRMRSGYVLRDGEHRTVDLRCRGRRSLPRWAASLHGTGEQLVPEQFGPDATPGFELGRYAEDFDYLGDLGGALGRDFDLDECNGRYCVTPEFPDGTFAYFVSIDAEGRPAFPFVVGPRSYGMRDGGICEKVPAEASTILRAGVDSPVRLDFRNVGSHQMLTWTSVEGGRYRIDGSYDGRHWINLAPSVRSEGLTTEHTVFLAPGLRPYRQFHVSRVAIEPYER